MRLCDAAEKSKIEPVLGFYKSPPLIRRIFYSPAEIGLPQITQINTDFISLKMLRAKHFVNHFLSSKKKIVLLIQRNQRDNLSVLICVLIISKYPW